MAPSYANLFMGCLQKDLLQQAEKKPSIWLRYIDDIFAIWPHGEEHLRLFIEGLKSYHRTIRFMAEWSSESVAFLDTRVILDGVKLVTDLRNPPVPPPKQLPPLSLQKQCRLQPGPKNT